MSDVRLEIVDGNEAEIDREANGAPCSCGGYADSDNVSDSEIAEYQTCGRLYQCCLGAFICRVCKKRFLVKLPAPQAD